MRRTLFALCGLAMAASAQESTAATEPTSSGATQSSTASAVATTAPVNTDTASTASTATTTTTGPLTHTVGVALGGHTFVPDVTLARVGDTILFQFYPTNHSVIRAEYGYPCIPYEDTGVDKVGFFSGFKPVDAILNNPPEWSIVVSDTNPIFYYCGAPGSCINYQMVGVINPNATTSLANQKNLAKDSTFMLLPGQPWPDEEEDPFPSTSTSAPTATSTSSTTPTASAGANPATSPSSSHHASLSAGAIAGIAIGAAAVALAAAVLLFICGRQSRQSGPSEGPRKDQDALAMQQGPFGPYSHQPMSPYGDATKHASMHSSITPTSPALPGYVPLHDPVSSPLQPAYIRSDALSPGPGLATTSDGGSTHSTSPNPGHAVPALGSPGAHNISLVAYPLLRYGSALPSTVHEMAALEPVSPNSQGGIIGFIRRSSIAKSGGAERYT